MMKKKTAPCPCGGTFEDIREETPGALNGPWRCTHCKRVTPSIEQYLPPSERFRPLDFPSELRTMQRGTALAKKVDRLIASDDRFARVAKLAAGTSRALFASLILATIARMEGALDLDDEHYTRDEIDYASKYVMAHAIFHGDEP